MEPGNEEQMEDRHAVASGEEEKQHEQNRKRDSQIGKRRSQTANAEQPDKLSKTVRFQHEAPNIIVVLNHAMCLLKILRVVRTQDRLEPVLVQKFRCMLTMTCAFSALDVFYVMDGRKSRHIKEVLDWYREEDAGDLRRSELSDIVESMTCLNALEVKFWKSEKSWKSEQSNQNIVLREEFVKISVVEAQIDPKVVDLNNLQPSNQKLLEEFSVENELWLLIGIPNRDPFLMTQYLERHSARSDQHMKKLMSLREGLHVMMQCYMRQHFADRYWLHGHPGRHAPWREPTMRTFTKESTTYFVKGPVCRWNIQKMQSESSEYVRTFTSSSRK